MVVQWCIKGLSLSGPGDASAILAAQEGLLCNWWRNTGKPAPKDVRDKLTVGNLDRHIHHFGKPDPATGQPFSDGTPFISLSAGVVERDKAAKTNRTHLARHVALQFGSAFGANTTAYLFTCWVIVGTRAAVEVEGISEEVRNLNVYRGYSPFHEEGEVTAKLIIPDNQIEKWEEWTDGPDGWTVTQTETNPRFTHPNILSNIRDYL